MLWRVNSYIEDGQSPTLACAEQDRAGHSDMKVDIEESKKTAAYLVLANPILSNPF